MAIGAGHRKPLARPAAAAGTTARAAGTAAAPEHLEQIVEIADIHLAFGLVLPALRPFGVRPVRIARPLGTALVDLAAIVARPLLRIRQQFVSRGYRLEARLGGRLAGVQIGVELLGELAVRLADLVGAGGRLNAEHLIGRL